MDHDHTQTKCADTVVCGAKLAHKGDRMLYRFVFFGNMFIACLTTILTIVTGDVQSGMDNTVLG